uniref:Uncharacterized protein n=1 Tax=Siphoviridae sp. ct16M3 TaxID=2825305 RepID=A0A8S5PR79_9CAUD|nr:MAG TPA: hypothetical protein [Siphoviridae sp. ct16M3]
MSKGMNKTSSIKILLELKVNKAKENKKWLRRNLNPLK